MHENVVKIKQYEELSTLNFTKRYISLKICTKATVKTYLNKTKYINSIKRFAPSENPGLGSFHLNMFSNGVKIDLLN